MPLRSGLCFSPERLKGEQAGFAAYGLQGPTTVVTTSRCDEVARMNPIEAVKAAAKARRARVREQIVYVDGAGSPDPMTVEAKFAQDGRRLTVRASNSRFWIETRTDTALLFSVGTPSRFWAPDSEPVGVLEGGRVPLFRPRGVPDASSRESLLAWFAEPANHALIEGLRLEQPEAVHIARNGLWMILRGDRVLDDGLFRIVVSLAAALETAPPAPKPPEAPFDGPAELEAFLREFRHLAESDDLERSELAERLTSAERAEFIRRIEPLFPAINAYLASLKGPWPAQAIDLAQLGELGSELIA